MNFLKSKKILFFIFTFFIFSFFFVSPSIAQDNTNADKYGLDDSASRIAPFQTQVNNYNANFLNTKIGSIIGIVLSFIGVLFLILMIYAGISWMTAGGSPEKVGKAKGLIINATIGLIIVLAAYAITSFIGNSLL